MAVSQDRVIVGLYVGAIVAVIAGQVVPIYVLGQVMRALLLFAGVSIVVSFTVGAIWAVAVRNVKRLQEWAWNGLHAKYLYEEEPVTAGDIPSTWRVRVAWASKLVEDALLLKPQWIDFEQYHKEMAEEAVENTESSTPN